MVRGGGFLGPGLPFGETARIALRPGRQPGGRQARPSPRRCRPGGYRVRDRNDAAPGFSRLIDQLEYFLGFIGLSSLIAGGLGVSGAVGAYLEARKPSIAALKALGADGALARNVYLIQIALLAALGVAIGLVVGGAAPLILGDLVKNEPAGPGAVRALSGAAGQGRAVRPAVGRRLLAGAAGPGPGDAAGGAVPPGTGRAPALRAGAGRRAAGRRRAWPRWPSSPRRPGSSAAIMIGGVAAAFVVAVPDRPRRRLGRRRGCAA